MNTNILPAQQTIATFAPALLTAPRVRARQPIASNFRAALGATHAAVVTTTVARLVAMLDCAHCEGSRYVVVSKEVAGKRCAKNATTVLDVPLGRVYRAEHAHGLASLWKDIASRSAGAVEYLRPAAAYVPPVAEPVQESHAAYWAQPSMSRFSGARAGAGASHAAD